MNNIMNKAKLKININPCINNKSIIYKDLDIKKLTIILNEIVDFIKKSPINDINENVIDLFYYYENQTIVSIYVHNKIQHPMITCQWNLKTNTYTINNNKNVFHYELYYG